jgi:hypothetical protein
LRPYVEAHIEEEAEGPHLQGEPRHEAERRPRLTFRQLDVSLPVPPELKSAFAARQVSAE